MLKGKGSFPHPVLGSSFGGNLDMSGEFDVKLSVNRNGASRTVDFHIEEQIISNEYIKGLIDEGRAVVGIKIYCSATMLTFFKKNATTVRISEDSLSRKAEVSAVIITEEEIKDYNDQSFNGVFGGSNFEVQPGDVIGVTGNVLVNIDKIDEKAGISNIFIWSPVEYNMPTTFECTGDKIVVNYSKTFDGKHPHNQLFQMAPWTAVHVFVLPALTYAINAAQLDPDAYVDKDWCDVVLRILQVDELPEDDAFTLAQAVFNVNNPLINCFNELNTLTTE